MMHRICAILSVFLCFLAVTPAQAGKNTIYKGVISVTDLLTGKTQRITAYLVLGEEEEVAGLDERYNLVKSRLIAVNGSLGPKRYAILPEQPRFRSIERTQTIRKKERVIEIFTQVAEGDVTDSVSTNHNLDANLLSGQHTNQKYDAPITLKGNGLASFSGLGAPDTPPFGGASRSTWSFTLVPVLTDPIAPDETLEASVQRVTDYLGARGYVEFIPG